MYRLFSARWHKQNRRRKRRMRQGAVLARTLAKPEARFDPASPLYVIGDTRSQNGLSRAYRYETARWPRIDLVETSSPPPRQILIMGQPWDYPRLLAQTPSWFPQTYRIGLWVWELDQFPSDWHFALDIVHEIWTPSTFSANALRRGTDLPIKIVPHAVSVPKTPPLPRARFGLKDDQFLGMAIMDLCACPDRKNPVAHARAWLRAFGEDGSNHLLMKVRFKKGTRFAREALLKEIGRAKNITLVEEIFSDMEMAQFQHMADVYLSLHRAEGYGLNIHEMLEIGTPTVATGWSGNMDYMPKYPHAYPIPYQLVPYVDRTFAYEGQNLFWAEPDVDASAEALIGIQRCWSEARQQVPSKSRA
jgi:hypothetical protein